MEKLALLHTQFASLFVTLLVVGAVMAIPMRLN